MRRTQYVIIMLMLLTLFINSCSSDNYSAPDLEYNANYEKWKYIVLTMEPEQFADWFNKHDAYNWTYALWDNALPWDEHTDDKSQEIFERHLINCCFMTNILKEFYGGRYVRIEQSFYCNHAVWVKEIDDEYLCISLNPDVTLSVLKLGPLDDDTADKLKASLFNAFKPHFKLMIGIEVF